MPNTNEKTYSTGRSRFEAELALIQGVVRSAARRNRLGPDEGDDFESYVMLKLIEDNYGRLRKFEGKSSLATYLTVVIQRLFLDYRTKKWGRWKPSRRARSLGTVAVQLETLVYRDGLGFAEAASALACDPSVSASREKLRELFLALPVRVRPRWVEATAAEPYCHHVDEDAVERRERAGVVRKLEAALREAIQSLDERDRELVELRFRDRMQVSRIAGIVDADPRKLYTRLEKVLKHLRAALEARGLDRARVKDVLGTRELNMDLVTRTENAVAVRP